MQFVEASVMFKYDFFFFLFVKFESKHFENITQERL